MKDQTRSGNMPCLYWRPSTQSDSCHGSLSVGSDVAVSSRRFTQKSPMQGATSLNAKVRCTINKVNANESFGWKRNTHSASRSLEIALEHDSNSWNRLSVPGQTSTIICYVGDMSHASMFL
jgi:hypothetical protein